MADRRKRAAKKNVADEAQEEDEPMVKRGRGGGRQAAGKAVARRKKEEQVQMKQEPEEREEEEEDVTPAVTKKTKRGTQVGKVRELNKEVKKEEPTNEDNEMEEEVTVAAAEKAEVKKGRRGRKPVHQTEGEDAAAHSSVARMRGRGAAKEESVQEESKPAVKKGKRGRKPAVKTEEEDTVTEVEVKQEAPATAKKGKRGRPKAAEVKEEADVKSEAAQEEGKAASSAKASGGRNTKPKGAKGKRGGARGITVEEKENTDTSNLPKKSGEKTGVERVVVVKGRAAVDALCPIAQRCHVYEDGDDIWDCMLNQTNIQFNNNKYYLIQLLEDDSSKSYSVWMRWGRVGANGQNSLQACGADLDKAINIFKKKFSDKTKNDWELRSMFEKVPGKYDLLKMDYSKGTDTPDAGAAVKKPKEKMPVESMLHPIVKAIIELICDVRVMEEAVVEMKYDAKKAPLGKLTTEQIKAGYLTLKHIDTLIQSNKCATKDLVQACNDFYTRVPHYFGMKVPPLIRTPAEVREKVALLEALGDIQAALSVLDQPIDVTTHPADQHYHRLQCDLTPLQRESEEYRIIEKYMKTTHAKTHKHYTLTLLEVLECHKDSEHQRFKDVGNRMLLWHGSRMSNWAGILSQGLRIAPPEAPVTGYMFGKGIYFADMASKSANYCWANARNNVGFLLLSEVALGKSNTLLQADYEANKLPPGCHSVKGCGRTAPQPENFTKLPDGTVVPLGPGAEVAAKTDSNYSLLYNEYIVYDPAQVLTRFLLKVQFNF